MPAALLPRWEKSIPVVGMVHLRPLPGSPRFDGNLQAVVTAALRDAEALAQGGADGLMVENFNDTPFFPGPVPAHTVAHMTSIAAQIRSRFELPLGLNVLRNDGCSALSIAHAVGAELIRVNVLTGARLTDQGIVQGIAHDLLRLRAQLGAGHIRILADVAVKHSAPLADTDVAQEVEDAVERGGADAVIVSGSGTGKEIDLAELRRVRSAARAPVWLGSGVTPETIGELSSLADGFIVGSSLKANGSVDGPVDARRVRDLIAALR